MSSAKTVPAPAPVLVWFREDLRLADNPALHHAAATGRKVVALFVLDEASRGFRPEGGARRWWLHGSLSSLARDLARRGVPLILRRGPAEAVVPDVVAETGAASVVWNRRYWQAAIAVDRALMAALRAEGVEVASFQASLLHEPWSVTTKSGDPFRVYSPFWRACLAAPEPRQPLPAPERIAAWDGPAASDRLDDWTLLPTRPDWAGGLRETWRTGEAAARERLADFLDEGLRHYADERDRPDRPVTSRLSPHLAFGEISPFQLRAAALHAADAARHPPSRKAVDKFVSELGWREFSWHLLHHNPDLATRNFQPRFDGFPWSTDTAALTSWRRGLTGVPLVDAGMRELWRTGWMHNRVRMVVGSFLVKHLLQDWREGERWFHDTLVDFDLANNTASWQWVAGSGADAAPYFRVFNPVLQGEKFDPQGLYVRRHVPELARLSDRYVHRPWEAPASELAAAGIELGRDYPRPIVDLGEGRERALAAFETLRPDSSAA